MILLSIEQSTDIGSVAVLNGQNILAERQWTDTRLHSSRLFHFIPELLRDSSLDLQAIDAYAVGLGPGSYAGLRTSLAAAKAFALPDHRLIYGVSSAEVLAWTIFEQCSCASVMVIGDARRQQLWMRRFCRQADIPSADSPWHLIKLGELQAYCNSSSLCVTSDWNRIGAQLKTVVFDPVTLIEERRVPNAGSLGKLAEIRIQQGIPSERLSPIYPHPPVSGIPK